MGCPIQSFAIFAAQVKQPEVRSDRAEQLLDPRFADCRNIEPCRACSINLKASQTTELLSSDAKGLGAGEEQPIETGRVRCLPGHRLNLEQRNDNGFKAEPADLPCRRAGAGLRAQNQDPPHSAAEEPPDRLGRPCKQRTRELLGLVFLPAVEHRPVLDHLAAILAVQLRAEPKVAVLEGAKGSDW